jgi:methionyl-tRNA formyltransferase
MNIIFMGTSLFAVPTLQALYDSNHFVTSVFTKAPSKSGRGHKIQKSPIHIEAEKLGLNVLTPNSLKKTEIAEQIKNLNPDVIIVAAYGHILPKAVLDIPKFGCLNIHPSLLPRWRGAAPIERTILAGDKETAVCIMQMDEGLDTGDILLMKRVFLDDKVASDSLSKKLSELGAQMLMETLHNITNTTPQKQSTEEVSYAAKLTKEEAIIDWHKSAAEIDKMIRAFNPWPGCFFNYKDEQIKILEASVEGGAGDGKSGQVMDKDFTICCGKGLLKPLKLQRPGKKVLVAREFLNGMQIKIGTILE